jgi:uncharacterized protein (TIGR03437 family)
MKLITLLTVLMLFGALLAAQPSIDTGGILNVSSAQPTLAPNVVFVIYGKNLGPATIVVATAPNYPTILSNTAVTFTNISGGAAINAFMYYTVAGAVTGILPSSVAPGTYAVRVIYNGQSSSPQNVTVVARHFGIATANGAGTGVAQATDANVNGGYSLSRYTTSGAGGAGNFVNTPMHGGDSISLWGTGGGADAQNDTGGSSGDQTAAGNFRVTVGTRVLTPIYTGAVAGYPGLWVLIFTLPADIDPDCYATVQVSSNAELSNTVVLPIAAAGQSVCFDPQLTPAILSKLDSGGTITGGAFGVFKLVDTPSGIASQGASGGIYRWTATQWAAGAPSRPRVGSCTVYDRTVVQNGTDPAAPTVSLDASAGLGLTGPNLGPVVTLTRNMVATGPIYFFIGSAGSIVSGRYTLTGGGGTQVGPFSTATNIPASFTVTNFDSITSVNRSQPLVINWTSAGADQVYIIVSTATQVGSSNRLVTISCIALAGPGTFSVPVSALSRLQPATASGTSFGNIAVEANATPGTFTADLTGGGQLDFGTFGSNLGVSKNIAVQ